ncbi:PilZ domain-containing protein [Microvirga sp. TS319]|uniref:PilZ domain-containing protein n=1 Tax=Microvirga sp. TS319 TaxID=3241165 RepID=UPI00351AAE18
MRHGGLPERRSCERFRTDLEGIVTGYPPHQPIPCMIWDLSEKGVRLIFPEFTDVPVQFQLTIPSQGARANVHLVWTDGHFYGAKFID